jgi:hypothetical protein
MMYCVGKLKLWQFESIPSKYPSAWKTNEEYLLQRRIARLSSASGEAEFWQSLGLACQLFRKYTHVKYCWGQGSPDQSDEGAESLQHRPKPRDAYCLTEDYGLQMTFAGSFDSWTFLPNGTKQETQSQSFVLGKYTQPRRELLFPPLTQTMILFDFFRRALLEYSRIESAQYDGCNLVGSDQCATLG